MISKRYDTTKIHSIGQELFLNISLMEILKGHICPNQVWISQITQLLSQYLA